MTTTLAENEGTAEMKKLVSHFIQNGYFYKSLERSNWHGYVVAVFYKPIAYSTAEGEYINDNHIEVRVEFSCLYDGATNYLDDCGDINVDYEKVDAFIRKLIDDK
jgi:hypothetical protein